MVAAVTMGLYAEVLVRFKAVGGGTGTSAIGGLNADDPAYGQSLYPHAAAIAQTVYYQDVEPVPGTPGSWTLANLNTALTNAVATFAGTSGTPIIDATALANINGWSTGNP